MVAGVLPGPLSMVVFTSAEPGRSVRSVARVSTARTASASHPWLCLCCEAGLYCSAGVPECGPILVNFEALTAVLVMR